MKQTHPFFLTLVVALVLVGCGYHDPGLSGSSYRHFPSREGGPQAGEEYSKVVENTFLSPETAPLSTFSIDVDVAAYGTIRRMINQGQRPPADAVRTEEMLNYFRYHYPKPTADAPIYLGTEIAACPWNDGHHLVRIALKAREIPTESLPASHLVFLVDVSGSMEGPRRLGLVKASLSLLIDNLRPDDHVSIVTYASEARLHLPPTSGAYREKLKDALAELTAGGATSGAGGIQLAYEQARKHFIKGGNNRIILCTDGDFNVGISSPEELARFIQRERQAGIYLSVLGYGMGNYKDNRLQTLAEHGNGHHAYIETLSEARRVLVEEFGSSLYAVASDVKLQVAFNPQLVQGYRLIGYESRLLEHRDFDDDQKDAGELGSGQSVTALYEIIPTGIASRYTIHRPKQDGTAPTLAEGQLMNVALRYKPLGSTTSQLLERAVSSTISPSPSSDFVFASSVALFAELLRGSQYRGGGTYDMAARLAEASLAGDPTGYRQEFLRLVRTAQSLK